MNEPDLDEFLICHIITDLADGGAEAVLYRLSIFPQPGYRHIVITLGPEEKYAPMLRAAGITTYCLGLSRGRLTVSAFLRLVKLLRREKPDAVQTWMYHANLVGGMAARMAGCRNVVWGIRHGRLVPEATRRNTRLVNWLCARLSRIVPLHIVACAESARLAHQEYGYSAAKFVIIPNGYETAQFTPDAEAGTAIRAELGIDCNRPDHPAPVIGPVIGMVGRWHPDKDHANLLAAFAVIAQQFPGAQLVLAGTGCSPDNAALMALLHDHGIADGVHLLGRRNDIPAIMNALNLHVLSSRSEAFPNVVAEAMACGTLCVVTDAGDAALIVGDTGWVVPVRNSACLAKAIEQALNGHNDAKAWQARKVAARQRILADFSLASMVAQYHSVWNGQSG